MLYGSIKRRNDYAVLVIQIGTGGVFVGGLEKQSE
jgi:hypothetical protein